MGTDDMKVRKCMIFPQLYGSISQKRRGQGSSDYSYWVDHQSNCDPALDVFWFSENINLNRLHESQEMHDFFPKFMGQFLKNVRARVQVITLIGQTTSPTVILQMLTHIYSHKPLRKMKMTICNHQADSQLYLWPDV